MTLNLDRNEGVRMKICMVTIDGMRFKEKIHDDIDREIGEKLIEYQESGTRYFKDMHGAMDKIRKEQKELGLIEIESDHLIDEAEDLDFYYIAFRDGEEQYKIDRYFFFTEEELEE